MAEYTPYFLKSGMKPVPHTLLGIEGVLVQVEGENGLWKDQLFVAYRDFKGQGGRFEICISYDKGAAANTSNYFAITRDFDGVTGPLGEEQAREFWPEIAHLVKWHLCEDGVPLHYIANTLYHAGEGNFALARSSANWDDAPEELLKGEGCYLEVALRERLPALQTQFREELAATGLKLKP
jgi:hypothetical protein